MIQIKGSSANELFIKVSQQLLNTRKYSSPRGKMTMELRDVWLTLTNPKENLVTLPARNIDMDYLKAEMDWYNSGSLDVESIGKASTFWNQLADTNGTVNSNYGFLAKKQKWAGRSQVEWCIDRLIDDPETRQAIINYNQPVHKYPGNKDFVCTIAQSFRRNQGQLDSTVLMRSNDLIYGLTYDLPWFTGLQLDIAEQVDMGPGVYNHFAASLHVYAKHFKMLERIADSKI